jgi:putative polyketide hydroxylase
MKISNGNNNPTKKHDDYDIAIPVLIVGGSLVGLSMSLFLSYQAIDYLLIEKHPTCSIHPRAASFNPRTMEVFRTVGVERAIRDACISLSSKSKNGGILVVESLAGREIGWVEAPYLIYANENADTISPAGGWGFCAQDVTEPILRTLAERLGGNLQYATELMSFEQDADGITAKIKDLKTNSERSVRALYMIAADGGKSSIRHSLGVQIQGTRTLAHLMGIFFTADLNEALRGRKFFLCHIKNARVNGVLLPYDNNRYVLSVVYHPENGQLAKDYTHSYCADLICAAVGIPDLSLKILSVLPWALKSHVAERFQKGRVFLVGDSAHVMPPTGAFGANTGIQDAHNLAWKLSLVLKGLAGSELLSTYDTERRPVVESSVKQALATSVDRSKVFSGDNHVDTDCDCNLSNFPVQQADRAIQIILYGTDNSVILGYRYDSAAIIVEEHTDKIFEDPLLLTGKPGTRAPHIVLERNGIKISTLDLFGKDFVLLTGTGAMSWHNAAERISEQFRLGIQIYSIGANDCDLVDINHEWPNRFGVSFTDAVLVRPDGFVAWRSKTTDIHHERLLEHVLTRLLSTPKVV